MQLTVVGTGYVGLVTGACFAEMGHHVTCVDVDQKKIEDLHKGIIPIHEPGLDNLVISNNRDGRLQFTTNLLETMADTQVFFIAVGTPQGEDGSADLQYVLQVAREIGQGLQQYAVIVDKSTVPVGTADKVRDAVQAELEKRNQAIDFDVVSNPEFLKEGAAIADFMKPDRIVVGCHSDKAMELMRRLYAPFNKNHERTIFMGIRDAEMTKYAANSMLATKISFINEIAYLCEKLGVDVENVRRGIGSDSRIGFSFIYPGCGYGGSCFPKDVKALVRTAEENGCEPVVLRAVEERNHLQRQRLGEKVLDLYGADLKGKTFAVWGLAFKPGTDDMREAPAVDLIHTLIAAGADVKAYDPVAMEMARQIFPEPWFRENRLQLVDHQYQALEGAQALLLVTEWKPFRNPDFTVIRKMLKDPVIFDGRNQYDPEEMKAEGFRCYGIGRGEAL